MASPSDANSRFARDEEDSVDDFSLPLLQWAHSLKPLHKALSILILSIIFFAFVFSSLPLWRPIGVLMLHKLWDVMRFLVLTTGIGLGIVNNKFWRGNDADRDTGYSDGGKEDSVRSKKPFGGMFYSGLQSSYSFDDKEPEYGLTESGNETVGEENSRASSMAMASPDNTNSEDITKLVSSTISSVPSAMVGNLCIAKDTKDEDITSVVEESSGSLPSFHNNMKVASVEGKLRLLPQASDDLSLGGNEAQRPKDAGKVEHRRGRSLEFSILQEGSVRKPKDIHPVRDQERVSSSSIAPSSVSKASNHAERQSNVSSTLKVNVNPASASASTSRHHRSQSAFDLNDLLVHKHEPRSKPDVSSQLRKRRNVSLSCDLDTEFTIRGAPVWLEGLLSPPVPPPLMEGFESDASRGGVDLESKQGESSLRKAYTESLAPWRVAVPMNIPQRGDADDRSKDEKLASKEKKQTSPLKEIKTGVNILSPSSPKSSLMGSPGPAELNKKVDAFIARFHERMRLQRLESLERSARQRE